MNIDSAEVDRIAGLAKLALDDGERVGLARDLGAILDFVARLDEADTVGIEPLAHPLELAARLRPDAVTEGDRREVLMACAPAVENGLFLVPKVIE